MSGCIISSYGFQRQGKTLICYLIAEHLRTTAGVKVYSNMSVPGWIEIDSLLEIPFNFDPKIVLLDEAYYFLDSRSWEKNKETSIWFTTVGKQEMLLMFTSITPDMIEMRVRNQANYMFIASKDGNKINYNFWDIQKQISTILTLDNLKEIFANSTYDTKQIPRKVNISLGSNKEHSTDLWQEKVDKFYSIYKKQKQKVI